MKTTPEQLAELKVLAQECQTSVSDMTDAQYCRVFGELRGAFPLVIADLEEVQAKLLAYERDDGRPTELEMHRADYQACKAAGFESPGELLDAYKNQSVETERLKADLAQCRQDRQREHNLRVKAAGEADTLRQVFSDTANELGCPEDNEAVLLAIHTLREQVRVLSEALTVTEQSIRSAIATLDRDGDEWGVAALLAEALASVKQQGGAA